MRMLLPVVTIIVFAALAVSCGGGGGSGRAVIGVEGGVATSDDGKLTLDIPPGALDEEVELTISAVSIDELPEALREVSGTGPAYRLEPDGLVFNEPVPVTLELDRSELDDVPEDGVVAQLLFTQDADGEIEFLDELVTDAMLGEETVTVSGELSHFSWLTDSDGALVVELERVALKQEIDIPFTAVVLFRARRDVSRSVFTLTQEYELEPEFVEHYGVLSVVHVEAFFGAGEGLSIPGIPPGGAEFLRARYRCVEPDLGIYGIDTKWRDSEISRLSYRVTIRAEVDCVETGDAAQKPSPTPGTPAPGTFTPTGGTPEPHTATPVPPPSTDTPTPSPAGPGPTPETTMFTDPTGDEIVMGAMGIVDGGSDPAVDIRSVRIGPSASGTRVFVTFGSDPSQNLTHFTFSVLIALDERAGLIAITGDNDNSTAPAGGSFAVGVEGVLMVFPGPVPSGATLTVETIHQETESGDLGIDSFTAIVP